MYTDPLYGLLIGFLFVVFAYAKAMADVNRAGNLWHTWNWIYILSIVLAWGLIFYLLDVKYNLLNIIVICLLYTMASTVIFEMCYSIILTGELYGEYTRTLPIELLCYFFPNAVEWIDEHIIEVKYNQIRFEGWTAPAWDVGRIILSILGLIIVT